MGNKQPLGLSCDVGKARIATGGLRASIISPRTSYRLDNRQCSGDAKDSGEPEVAHCQRETTAKSSECRERDQLVQAWVPSFHAPFGGSGFGKDAKRYEPLVGARLRAGQ